MTLNPYKECGLKALALLLIYIITISVQGYYYTDQSIYLPDNITTDKYFFGQLLFGNLRGLPTHLCTQNQFISSVNNETISCSSIVQSVLNVNRTDYWDSYDTPAGIAYSGSIIGSALSPDINSSWTNTSNDLRYQARSDWTTHDNYPAVCGVSAGVNGIGDSLTCIVFLNKTYADTLYGALSDTAAANNNVSLLWTNATNQDLAIFNLWTNASNQDALIKNLWTNASNQDAFIVTLFSNATGQDTHITNLWSNASGQSIHITNLWTNASVQETHISNLWTQRLNETYANTLYIKLDGKPVIDWVNLTNYPAACTNGNVISQVGDTLTCVPVLSSGYNESWINSTIDTRTATIIYNVTSNQTITGTYRGGNIASLLAIDNNVFNVSEVSGANPMDLRLNFTGVTTFDRIVAYERYEGGVSGHTIEMEIYDYNLASWETGYSTISPQTHLSTITANILDPASHIQNGVVQVRFRHVNNGNTAHYFELDYIVLQDGFSTLTNAEHDGLMGRDHFNSNHPLYASNLTNHETQITNLWTNASVQETHISDLWTQRLNQTYAMGLFLNRSGTLTNGKFCTYNSVTGNVDCNTDETGDISAVTAGTGLTGGGTTGAVTVAYDPSIIVNYTYWMTNTLNRSGVLTAGKVCTYNSTSSSVDCNTDVGGVGTVTSVAAGNGLTGATITSAGTLAVGSVTWQNLSGGTPPKLLTDWSNISGTAPKLLTDWSNISGIAPQLLSDGGNITTGTIVYARHGYPTCGAGQFLNSTGAALVCQADATGGGASDAARPDILEANGVITTNASVGSGNLNVTGNIQLANNISSKNGIDIIPSGDLDDYLQVSTVSNIPEIKAVGGGVMKLTSDVSKGYIKTGAVGGLTYQYVYTDDGLIPFGFEAYNSTYATNAGDGAFFSNTGELSFQPNGDTTNYISFNTTATKPSIRVIGGKELLLAATLGVNLRNAADTAWVAVNASNFNDMVADDVERELNLENKYALDYKLVRDGKYLETGYTPSSVYGSSFDWVWNESKNDYEQVNTTQVNIGEGVVLAHLQIGEMVDELCTKLNGKALKEGGKIELSFCNGDKQKTVVKKNTNIPKVKPPKPTTTTSTSTTSTSTTSTTSTTLVGSTTTTLLVEGTSTTVKPTTTSTTLGGGPSEGTRAT